MTDIEIKLSVDEDKDIRVYCPKCSKEIKIKPTNIVSIKYSLIFSPKINIEAVKEAMKIKPTSPKIHDEVLTIEPINESFSSEECVTKFEFILKEYINCEHCKSGLNSVLLVDPVHDKPVIKDKVKPDPKSGLEWIRDFGITIRLPEKDYGVNNK